MCTLTFTDRVVATATDPASQGASSADGAFGPSYRLFFNRDERLSRGREIAPAEALSESGVRYIAPTDSDAGGTWIAVNEFGVTVALLNGYAVSKGCTPDVWTSRGALVRGLADLRGTHGAWNRLSPAELRPFRPAVIAIIAPNESPLLARWDGRDVVFDVRADRQAPITSSSYEQDEVQRFRRDLYREIVGDPLDRSNPPTPEALVAYHSYTGQDGPSALTPSMARSDAATRSFSAIEVDPGQVRFRYGAGAPHEVSLDHVVTLRATV